MSTLNRGALPECERTGRLRGGAMRSGRRWVAAALLGSALACWAVLLGAAGALAEDWTPPPGAPPGCQPPPGECFPAPDAPIAPVAPAPQPTPAPTAKGESTKPATSDQGTTSSGSSKTGSSQAASSDASTDNRVTGSQVAGSQVAGSQFAGSQDPGSTGGDSPTLRVSQVPLRVGEPANVPILIEGINPADNPQAVAVITITGGTGTAGGMSGSTLTIESPLSQLEAALRSLVVTPTAETVTVSVRAYPADRPEAGITASQTLTAASSSQAASVNASTPASQPSGQPGAVTATEAGSASNATKARQLTLPSYDPLQQPKQTVDTTITAVALIGVVGAAAGSVAAGIGANTGPGTSGAPRQSNQGSSTQGPSTQGRREDQATQMLAPGDSGSFLAIDTNLSGLAAAAGAAGLRRRAATWRLPWTQALDSAVAAVFAAAARISPLSARMVADSTYLRAMFGSASLLLPIAGIVLGILAVLDVAGAALAPTTALLGAVVILGALDALAGFLAVTVFVAGVAISGGITDASSVRTLLGLAIIGFGPALIAGASRPMRRAAGEYSAWERVGDFVVIPLVGAFAVQGTVHALPALSGYDLPVAGQANLLALLTLIALVLRVGLEELAARAYPERIAAIAPPDIPPHGPVRRLALVALRTFLFGFAAVAFIGNVWQLWVGLALFAAAEGCALLAPRMPNSPSLFHLVPAGIPRFVFIVLVAIGLGTLASLLVGDGPDLARASFVLLLIPGLVLAALGMFGRAPRDGDVRWYLRPGMRTLYRAGGVLMIAVAIWLTQFPPT